ncbi:hypothetical protein R1CP_34485 [Rhodococcus opacus]|uniref:Uncharacterized protein n=1 Tax=Rhodococcus opacus TaxID=37919 RepID=A0A1B1KFY0_RHOOP|nr:hypothetical protein R1CP_34485 [Rhodococcus opacus]
MQTPEVSEPTESSLRCSARGGEKLHVTVTLAGGETVPIHHPTVRPERPS